MGENEYGLMSEDMDPLVLEKWRTRDAKIRTKNDRWVRTLLTLIAILGFPYIPATFFTIMTTSGSFSEWYISWVGICALLAFIAWLRRV